MTMKNELTLKHGAFIAAAVLLIAGIAFAGAVAGDPVHKIWDATNFTYMVNNGGYYVVDVPSGEIANVVSSYIEVNDNLTLDFNYQPLALGTCTGTSVGVKGAIFPYVYVKDGKVLTIKNLDINGGKSMVSTNMAGVVIGFIGSHWLSDKIGCCVVENVTIKNVTVQGSGSDNVYIGGIVGGINTNALKISNATVENSIVSSAEKPCGGFLGVGAHGCAVVVENSSVLNTYVSGGGAATDSKIRVGTGGIIGSFGSTVKNDDSIAVRNCSVENCIIKSDSLAGIAGIILGSGVSSNQRISPDSSADFACAFIGANVYSSTEVTGCKGTNCVVKSIGPYVGSIIGETNDKGTFVWSASTFTATNNVISSCTLVNTKSSGNAGGFTGKIKSAAIASISNNTISNCCIVATSGNAAGFCPSGA